MANEYLPDMQRTEAVLTYLNNIMFIRNNSSFHYSSRQSTKSQ